MAASPASIVSCESLAQFAASSPGPKPDVTTTPRLTFTFDHPRHRTSSQQTWLASRISCGASVADTQLPEQRSRSELSQPLQSFPVLVGFRRPLRHCFQEAVRKKRPEMVFMNLAFHAIKHDSQNIAQHLVCHELSSKLNGFVPSSYFKNSTYLHLSLLGDAPRVVAQLVKYGADIWTGEGDYPDLTPLCLAIARPRDTQDLDGPLRIACSYAFARTCQYLLTRGAAPNKIGRLGLAAIHSAVMKRLPWRNFPLTYYFLGADVDVITAPWTSMMLRTVSTLLWFGADPNLPSTTSRVHSCRHQCWRSPDCNRGAQTALHFACGIGELEVVQLLLQHGANPEAPDADGYLPLFSAICQDHTDLAMRLLQNVVNAAGHVIVKPHRSTVLHIACRFAAPGLVRFLLERGADANGTDQFGQTPLHEVMGQTSWELEDRVLETLHLLADHGALPDFRAGRGRGRTARDMAAQHPFSRVWELF